MLFIFYFLERRCEMGKVRMIPFGIPYDMVEKGDRVAKALLLIPAQWNNARKKALVVFRKDFSEREIWEEVSREENLPVLMVEIAKRAANRILEASITYLLSTYGIRTAFVDGKEFFDSLPREITLKIRSVGGKEEEISACVWQT
jgi:hypothetical protein